MPETFEPMKVIDEASIRLAFGQRGDDAIKVLNDILSEYPKFNGIARGENSLKKANSEALKKAKKAKEMLDKAIALINEIGETHHAIYDSILSTYKATLMERHRNDDEFQKDMERRFSDLSDEQKTRYGVNSSEEGQLARYKTCTQVNAIKYKSFELLNALDMASCALKCNFFQGKWEREEKSGTKTMYRSGEYVLFNRLELFWENNRLAVSGMTKSEFFSAVANIESRSFRRKLDFS